jgi:hypothetical protein
LETNPFLRIVLLAGTLCWFSCKQQGRSGIPTGSGGVQKIVIDRDHVYDLSGYADDSGGDPFNLFDENDLVDPRFEGISNSFAPVTSPQPRKNPAIYFNSPEGSRIVTDLRICYRVSDVYIYDRSGTGDSVWIYSGNMQRWRRQAAFLSGTVSGAPGWRRFSVDDSTRYIMIRFSSYETEITEMVIYGTPCQSVSAIAGKPELPAAPFTPKTLNEFVGVNYVMESEAKWLKPFHYSRLYKFSLDFDNDTIDSWPNIRYNMLHYGYWNKGLEKYVFDIDTLRKINNGNLWYSLRGVSGWMNAKGISDRARPTNIAGLDPDDPTSYSRHAQMMWHIAAFYGHAAVDTNGLSLSHEPRRSGLGLMHFYENGNEENASWIGSFYCTPTAYFAQSSADLDGDEGRLGKKFGIVNADPSAKLMMSGLTGLDTNRVKVYKFLSDNLRRDQLFPWQAGIQYHYYCGRNGKGISPEEDSLRFRLARVRAFTSRIQPGIECFLGENGYDKQSGSRQCTPLLPGYSASESQGIMLLRSINAVFFSGFDADIIYWLRDTEGENRPSTYMSSGLIYKDAGGKMRGYPAWYYICSMVNVLGNYRPDRIVSEKGKVWIYKYRSVSNPDSVAYFFYAPTVNGTKLDRYSLQTASDGRGMEINFEDQSETGRSTPVAIINGVANIAVGEMPGLLLLKE